MSDIPRFNDARGADEDSMVLSADGSWVPYEDVAYALDEARLGGLTVGRERAFEAAQEALAQLERSARMLGDEAYDNGSRDGLADAVDAVDRLARRG